MFAEECGVEIGGSVTEKLRVKLVSLLPVLCFDTNNEATIRLDENAPGAARNLRLVWYPSLFERVQQSFGVAW